MPNPTHILINSYTVGSGSTSSVTFSSIPNTYTDLVVKVSARTVNSGAQNINLSFNGSTSNFSCKMLYSTGSATGSSSYPSNTPYNTSIVIGGSDYTANTFNSGEIYIPNYAGSTNKSFSTDSTTENNATASYIELFAQLWSQTSAITSMTLTTTSGNYAQYSTFYLYGVKNS